MYISQQDLQLVPKMTRVCQLALKSSCWFVLFAFIVYFFPDVDINYYLLTHKDFDCPFCSGDALSILKKKFYDIYFADVSYVETSSQAVSAFLNRSVELISYIMFLPNFCIYLALLELCYLWLLILRWFCV